MHFDAAEYCRRIGMEEPRKASEETLRAMHRAQLFTIPFENFDIQLGRGIDVSPAAIYEKLVRHPRGGYCFELNGLFLQALLHFGFEARALLARVHVRGEPSGRTHQLSLIEIEGREWIADVGFGASTPRAPLPFEFDRITEQDGARNRLIAAEPWGIMLQQEGPEGWENLYSFDLMHVCRADIATGNHYTSTHPGVHFTKMRMANLPNAGGRLSLADFVLTEVRDGETRRVPVPDGESYLGLLREKFGIELDADYGDLKRVQSSGPGGDSRSG